MKSKSPRGRGLRVLLLTLSLLVVVFVWLLQTAYNAPPAGRAVSLDQVFRFAANGEIISVRLLDEDSQVVGERCPSPDPVSRQASSSAPSGGQGLLPPGPSASSCLTKIATFRAVYPRSDVSTQDLIERVSVSGGKVVVDKQSGKAIAKLIANFIVPLLMLANLFGIIFVSKGGSGSVSEIVGFGTLGRNRARKRLSGTGVTFADVAGASEAVAELREVIDYLKDPKRYEAYGAAPPKGVLVFGPPGCGKTLLARATAGETGVPFFSVSGTEFVESLVGVGAARVRDLFKQVREASPAIVFIDEIDAAGRKRTGEGSSGGEREQTLNQLLVEMDGFQVTSGIVVMAATNRPDILDPALLRPGRFDRHVALEAPDLHGRCEILKLHARRKPLDSDVDLEEIARRTPGFTGADLANVVNEAALLAIREGNATPIQEGHLREAIQRVLHGPQRRGKLMSAEERKRISFHEAGHAVVAAALDQKGRYPRVSIVARSKGLGQASTTGESERVLWTAGEMRSQLATATAGRVAEELVFGEASTTAQDDIEVATGLSREMVGIYGMFPEIGGQRLIAKDEEFLGVEGLILEAMSGNTMQAFDRGVKGFLDEAEQTAMQVLINHRSVLEELAAALEHSETLEGPPLDRLISRVRPQIGSLNNGAAPSGDSARRRKSKAAAPRQSD